METIRTNDARSLPYDERVAREVVTPYINATLVALPEDGQEPTPDFKVQRGGDCVGWLEVTRGTHEPTHRLDDQLKRIGRKFTTDLLRHNWFVILKPEADAKRINREKDRLVLALLARELTLVPYPTNWMDDRHPESDAILNGYHVHHAGPVNPADGDAVVMFNLPGQMHWVDANTINRLAEKRFDAKRSQLEGREGERHLFVWVDAYERSGAGVAMYGFGDDDDYLPGEAPVFPEWVSDVWLLNTVGRRRRLWHCSRATGAWKTYDVDPTVFNVENT